MQRIKKAYADSGDLKIIPDIPPLDGSENWEQGRGAYYELDNDPNTGDPLALDIDREQDNYFKNIISKNIKHWQENSYPNWFDDIEYPKNATVKYTDENIYVSLVNNNTALPTDTDNWVNFEDFGSLNINPLPNKPTPDDTDNFALQEVGGDLKKLSFANFKLSLFNPTLTADATLTGIDNKIVMNGIVTTLGLEIGDVIKFTSVANTNNQKMRTVESIINNNEIIVNYEHCGNRGKGTLKLTDEILTNATITRISKWYNAPIGLGQGWVKLLGFRVGNTNYTNATNRTITVFAHLGSAAIQTALIIVDGVIASFSSFEASLGATGATAPVNAGGIYKSFAGSGSQTVTEWAELR